MNDEFLYEPAPSPSEEFAISLYERLSESGHASAAFPPWLGANRRTMAYAFSVIMVAVIAVACARELFRQRYVQVGEMWVLEVGPSYSFEIVIPAVKQLEPHEVLSRPPQPISVIEAVEMMPYPVGLPTWIPDGYSLLESEVYPPLYPDWRIALNWSNGGGDRLALWALAGPSVEIRAPAGTWEEVRVNGRAAVLVRGRFPGRPDMSGVWEPWLLPSPGPEAIRWKIEDEWDEEAGLGLTWRVEGATLHLQTYGVYLSFEDLIRVAETMGGR